jgi:hypothetical protein
MLADNQSVPGRRELGGERAQREGRQQREALTPAQADAARHLTHGRHRAAGICMAKAHLERAPDQHEREVPEARGVESERDQHGHDRQQRHGQPGDRPAVSARADQRQRRCCGHEQPAEDEERPHVLQAAGKRANDVRRELAADGLRGERGGERRAGGCDGERAGGQRVPPGASGPER